MAHQDIDNELRLDAYLKHWWSTTFNRPLKDPILLSYTTEELLYEYYERIERQLAEQVQAEQETDKIDNKKIQDTLDWAEKEEQAELNQLNKKQGNKEFTKEYLDPMDDPANKEWVEKQLEDAKKLYGEDFGEDIDTDFGEVTDGTET